MTNDEYEELCEQSLRNQEAVVRELRFDAVSTGDPVIRAALRRNERLLHDLRRHIMHSIPDPKSARRIIHGEDHP